VIDVNIPAFHDAMRKKVEATIGVKGATYDRIAADIGISQDTLLRLAGRKGFAYTPRLITYVRCCAWLGCSLYKFTQ
jgi:hypothetical protein